MSMRRNLRVHMLAVLVVLAMAAALLAFGTAWQRVVSDGDGARPSASPIKYLCVKYHDVRVRERRLPDVGACMPAPG